MIKYGVIFPEISQNTTPPNVKLIQSKQGSRHIIKSRRPFLTVTSSHLLLLSTTWKVANKWTTTCLGCRVVFCTRQHKSNSHSAGLNFHLKGHNSILLKILIAPYNWTNWFKNGTVTTGSIICHHLCCNTFCHGAQTQTYN